MADNEEKVESIDNCEKNEETKSNGIVQSPQSTRESGGSNKKKNKKKKGKKKNENTDISTKPVLPNAQTFEQLRKAMTQMKFTSSQTKKSKEDIFQKKYEFWSTQPVPKLDEVCCVNEAVEADKDIEELRKEEYTLLPGFYWDNIDIDNPDQLKELYILLNENYVEDDDNMFRFDYSSEFLKWALKPPGWKKHWLCGIRLSSNKKLVCFISAVPARIKIYDTEKDVVEINFLCVHKKLREKRVAPVLIREITRRVNLEGIFQAVYTAGVVIPKPVATCRYWHRSLNPKKLVECKFSNLSRNMTMSMTIKLYKLPEEVKLANFRPIEEKDIDSAYAIVFEYLSKFSLAPIFTKEDFVHWFMPIEGVMDCYVVTDDEGKVTDLVSFYTLPSTIMKHALHKSLKAAYAFYTVSTKTPLIDLMYNALIIARKSGFDVFNALDLMDNKEFLEKLKFGVGDGNLQYYLYNWKCPYMEAEKVGLVLQ